MTDKTKNKMKTELRNLETEAKSWLSSVKKKPQGTDRHSYVSVDYSACGEYEMVTSQGAVDYIRAEALRAMISTL